MRPGTPPQSTESFTLDQARELLPETQAWTGALLERLAPLLAHGALDVLDVGSAQGRALIALTRLGHRASGVEPWPAALNVGLELARREGVSAEMREGRAEALPYADEQFDLVLAVSVMEHVDDLQASLREIHRVLRPGGIFWFSSTSARSPRQSEIARFPLFGWYPDPLKRRIMLWAMERRPHLIGHTQTPALHWWTPRKAREELIGAGFLEVWDYRWDLRTEEETSPRGHPFLRVAQHSRAARLLGDVLIQGAAYAGRKGERPGVGGAAR